MHSKFYYVALFFMLVQVGLSQSTYSRIKFDLSKIDINDLTRLGLETDHGFNIPGVHFVNDFSQEEISLLENANIDFRILIPDLEKYYNEKPQASERSLSNCEDVNINTIYDYNTPENYTYGSMGGYHTYEELLIVLDSMRSQFPHLISAKSPIGTFKTWESNMVVATIG